MSTSFNSEELDLFANVLDRACAQMLIHDEVTRNLIATRIFHLAEGGERNPDRLLRYAKSMNGSFAA